VSELDDLYLRLKEHWHESPEKLERDEPLLARAFREAQPNRDLQAALEQSKRDFDRAVGESIHAIEALQRERDTAREDLATVQAQRSGEARAHAVIQQRLEGQLADSRPREPVTPTFEADEQQQLAALGWRKGI
jgi:Arc/MetJ family transcription regulator